MKLSDDDSKLYYELMWGLQFYVNQRLGILPDISGVNEYRTLDSTNKLKVRDALFKESGLIDGYVAANPDHLSPSSLAIVRSWQNFVAGDFMIERHLAKYTIFIKGDQVYGVIGLMDPLSEIVPRWRLPAYVKTVLLPFRGRIIYDGLLEGYNILIGRGIATSLKETYLAAKQNGRIVESLEVELAQTSKSRAQAVDWRPHLDALLKDTRALRSTNVAPAIEPAAFSALKAAAELAHTAVHAPDDIDALRIRATKVERALRKVNTVLDRSEW